MAANDDDESTAVIVGVLAAIALAVTAVSFSGNSMSPQTGAGGSATEMVDIAPIGEPLAKVFFEVGGATLTQADKSVVSQTVEALAAKPGAIVLLSGFHDPSGNAKRNAELAKARAFAVRDALVAGGVATDRVKFRKPESTVGTGSPEEGRRVEIRVQ